MKWYLLGGLLGLGVASLYGPGPGAAQAQKQTGWLTDYAQARALARQTGKPLLVVFRCQP